jgi:hypothetical protein
MSPDGRWLAYVSNESGIPEVYVRNWPELDNKWQISRDGGTLPHWNENGSELVFKSAERLEIRAVTFEVENGQPEISLPFLATRLDRSVNMTAYSADHQTVLAGFSKAELELPPVRVLDHWDD